MASQTMHTMKGHSPANVAFPFAQTFTPAHNASNRVAPRENNNPVALNNYRAPSLIFTPNLPSMPPLNKDNRSACEPGVDKNDNKGSDTVAGVEGAPPVSSFLLSKGHGALSEFEAMIRSAAESSPIDPLKLMMPPEIATELKKRLSEDRRFRLDYWEDETFLMVTFPTDVHESFKSVVSPFTRIAETDPSFIVHTGIELPVQNSVGVFKAQLPDFSFGRKATGPGADPTYGIVVECGYSQSFPDLKSKLRRWFSVPSIEGVVIIKFFCGELELPTSDIPLPSTPVDRATFSATSPSGLGPITYDGHTWAPRITKIVLSVYVRESKDGTSIGHDFDITPVDNNPTLQDALHETQEDICEILHLITSKFMGEERFNAVYSLPEDFRIPWDAFYDELKSHLGTDAYRRYVIWAGSLAVPNYTPPEARELETPNLLKRVRELSGNQSRPRKRAAPNK